MGTSQRGHSLWQKERPCGEEDSMQIQMGADSLCLPKPVYIMQTASVVGKLEGEGPLGYCFDMICTDEIGRASCRERV